MSCIDASIAFSTETLSELKSKLSSEAKVLLPADTDYPTFSDSWNKDLLTNRPSLVIVVTSTTDVVQSIQYIRRFSLPFTVGCGFHSRYSLRSGHVLINLGGMRKVRVDPEQKLCYLQGGCRNDDLDKECSKFQLFTTAGTDGDTGIGGLMLGGGIGFLARRLGLSIDQFVEIEIVNYEGTVLRANHHEHSDLFWATKGAGFNFGVVTEFVVRIHQVGHRLQHHLTLEQQSIITKYDLPMDQSNLENKMILGMLPYPVDTFKILGKWLEEERFKPNNGLFEDRSLTLIAVLGRPPTGPRCMILFVYVGDNIYQGYQHLDVFLNQVGQPLVNNIQITDYYTIQNALKPFTPPSYYYERIFISKELHPDLVSSLLESFHDLESKQGVLRSTVGILCFGHGGALTEPDHMNEQHACFSFEQRSGNYWILIRSHYDPNQCKRDTAIEWSNETKKRILPYCTTQYTNSASNQPGSNIIYGSSLEKLRSIKQKYDPTNFFCNNQNVVPADQPEETSATALYAD